MALGKLNECWVCHESEKCRNKDFKQICTPIRGKTGTMLSGVIIWLCKDCKKEVNR